MFETTKSRYFCVKKNCLKDASYIICKTGNVMRSAKGFDIPENIKKRILNHAKAQKEICDTFNYFLMVQRYRTFNAKVAYRYISQIMYV